MRREPFRHDQQTTFQACRQNKIKEITSDNLSLNVNVKLFMHSHKNLLLTKSVKFHVQNGDIKMTEVQL